MTRSAPVAATHRSTRSAQAARLALTEAWVRGPGLGAVWRAAAVKGRISAAAGAGGPSGQVPADEGAEEGGGRAQHHPGGELPTGDPVAATPRGCAVHAWPGPPGTCEGRRLSSSDTGCRCALRGDLVRSPAGQHLVDGVEELPGGALGHRGEEALADAAEHAADGGVVVVGQFRCAVVTRGQVDGDVGRDRARGAGTAGPEHEAVGGAVVGEADVAGVGAADRRHPGGDGHGVGVLADLLQALAAGDGPDEHRRVAEGLVDRVDGGVEGGGAGDPHRCWSSFRAWPSRRAHSSDGEIGMRSTKNPSASEMAAARTAAAGMVPASPAPLMPRGLSGDGVSRWSISTLGTSEAYGIRKSMNEALSSWPLSS